MSINIDIKKLWLKQSSEIPEAKEIIEKADRFRKKSLRKLIITNILLILTSAFIGFVWYYYQPEMITTKIGITITILAMIIYLAVYNFMIPLLTKTDYSMNSSLYLEHLLKLKDKQRYLQTTMINIYFILLSSGIALYMFEYASRMKTPWGITSYLVVALWMAFNWFYLRPKSIEKQENSINDLITKFEKLSNQLTKE